MKPLKQFILSLCAVLWCTSAFCGGRIVTSSVSSNILGADVKYNVYLPEGYKSTTHYPVIYLLHGLTDTYTAWVEKGNMKPVADELIWSGECRSVVIVMPNAGGPDTENTWNGYFNMPGWNYEDFFFNEFIPEIESRYNAGGSKGQRSIMGLSMGGGGSTVYCQRHPEMFATCYAMSSWYALRSVDQGFPPEDGKLNFVKKAVMDNSVFEFMEKADEKTIAGLKTVKWFFDCGDDDPLLDYTVDLYKTMRNMRIKGELRVRNGIHNWEYWHHSIRVALPFASRNFSE